MPSDSSARETRRNLRIGPYEVLQYLATGGMAAVYKARHADTGQIVALKVLPPEVALKPGMLERFKQEAVHAGKLNHWHIVGLFEYGESNHTHYLAMELVEGIDLHEYVSRKGPLDPDEARVIIAQGALALEYAHEKGIVHRDIKPSNFLITRIKGRLWVKLTDFGLAREASDDEFRITRAGNTVGTVDYMAPEQARDSRAADHRSDIYSLGCTLYFMLAGRPPFPEGGLTERIMKHAENEPDDICTLNRKVPQQLAAVLQRMLAKKPANRYQTATALIEDLNRLHTGSQPRHLEVFAFADDLVDQAELRRRAAFATRHVAEEGDSSPTPASSQETEPRPDSSTRRRRREEDTEAEVPAQTAAVPVVALTGNTRRLVFFTAPVIVALLALGMGVTWWLLRPSSSTPGPSPETPPARVERNEPAPEPAPPADPEPRPVEAARPEPKPVPPVVNSVFPPAVKPESARVETGPPRLVPAAPALSADALREEFLKPWAAAPVRPAALTLQVSRSAVPGDGRQFTTLADAVAAAPADQETVIEIHDNGPLFESAMEVRNRSLTLRAAKGYRPLLAWERDRPGVPRANVFLTVYGGNLTLDNVDLVCRASDAEDLALCRVTDGDFLARNSTFSVAGRGRGTVSAIQLTGAKANSRTLCRLSACYLRGGDFTALDLRTPGVEVLLEDCLVVGGARPLLDVAGKSAGDATVLRVLRSTLVAGQTVLRVRPETAAETRPLVRWIGWDALLTRCHSEAGGEMVVVADGASSGGLDWRATNCLYAGWGLLLGGREQLASAALAVWQARWGRGEGDRALAETWPARVAAAPWEEPPDAYGTAGQPVWFAGTAGADVLGCKLAALPPVREAWHALTYGRYLASPFAMPTELTPPEIPAGGGGFYHGERLNLNEVDLGEHLEKVRQKMPFAARVVLHLTGSGERHTSPVRVKGSSLILYYEPPPDDAEPLVLTYSKGRTNPEALLDVEDGSLDLLGVSLKLGNNNLLPHPRHLIRVKGGDLRVFGARLIGPLGRAPKTFEGLVGFEGSGVGAADKAHNCGIAQSVLAAGNTCVHIIGAGAHVQLRNCVVVAGRDAVHFDPGADALARLNSHCLLELCTVAARRAAVRVGDLPDLVPLEPFVVQARNTAFLDPFTGGAYEAALLVHEAEALARGVLVWQGDANAYDKRLPSYVAPATPAADQPRQGSGVWSRLWGASGDRAALTLDLAPRAFDLDKLPFETLNLPAAVRAKRAEPLGADLAQLRLLRKPEKPKRP